MQDETLSEPLPLPRPRRTLMTILVALLAFAVGGAVVGWLVNSGRLPYALPKDLPARQGPAAAPSAAPPVGVPVTAAEAAPRLGSLEARLAMIEDRLTRIDVETMSASGNAARAEALLIAYAARRRIEKGEALGFVEDQLKLRFGGAQPDAVRTIVAAAKDPVTLDDLSGQLEAAAPGLAGKPRDESTWARLRRELASLFVVRRGPAPAVNPTTRVARARLMVAHGRIDDAIAEVERLPGADEAQDWIEAARRYQATQQALDVIETAAMLERRGLRDAAGNTVEQPSPLAPTAEASATPAN